VANRPGAGADQNRVDPRQRYDEQRFADSYRNPGSVSAGPSGAQIDPRDSGQPAPSQAASDASRRNRAAAPRSSLAATSRPGQPPLALDGFCPVTLLKKETWQKGNPQWGVIHRGRTYLFVGEKEKSEFFANPDQYSPVLSGIDPVALTETGVAIDGKRAHGVVYRQQMYLFASEENLQKFWNSPDDFAAPIMQAMRGVEPGTARR
jgi:protein disulfide-isomerase